MTERLFVYGTLRPGRAPSEIADAVNTLVPLGPAAVRGRLYNLGSYPGLVLDEQADEVHGEILAVPDAATLARLDAYEDYRPNGPDPDASLFLRVRTAVTLPTGASELCWVYVYNRPIPEKP